MSDFIEHKSKRKPFYIERWKAYEFKSYKKVKSYLESCNLINKTISDFRVIGNVYIEDDEIYSYNPFIIYFEDGDSLEISLKVYDYRLSMNEISYLHYDPFNEENFIFNNEFNLYKNLKIKDIRVDIIDPIMLRITFILDNDKSFAIEGFKYLQEIKLITKNNKVKKFRKDTLNECLINKSEYSIDFFPYDDCIRFDIVANDEYKVGISISEECYEIISKYFDSNKCLVNKDGFIRILNNIKYDNRYKKDDKSKFIKHFISIMNHMMKIFKNFDYISISKYNLHSLFNM